LVNGQIDGRELFFSAAGRAARGPSIMAAVVLLAIAAFYEAIPSVLHWITGWVAYPALIYCAACVLSKRLHDRGRSGWWAALILFSTVAIWPQPNSFFDFPFTLVAIWAVIDLAVMPGETGTNRFGVNPLKPAVAV
jgi:uncharacterized membrane protein YhaH (DUF805 family)